MANYTYKGTKITGTSTTAKVFKKSGIKKAHKNNTYLNTSTGHVYQCTDAGDKGKADEAKWKYLRTDIVQKPTVCVSGLGAPVRGSGGARTMTAKWKTPDAMIDTKKGDRATALDINWFLGISGKDPKEVIHTGNEKLTTSTVNLNNLTIGKKTYTRSSFYPFSKKPKLSYVTVKVISKNAKGAGKSVSNTRKFSTPKAPTISAFSFNDVGELTCTITTDPGAGYAERYDTWYQMKVYYSSTKKTATIYPNKSDSGTTTATTKTLQFDDVNYAARAYGEYAKVTVKAKARGYAGDSKTVEKVFYISYPSEPVIKSVSISAKDSSGKCVVYVDPKSSASHPVDRIKLEILANTEYANASQIPAGAGWETTDIVDDAQCKAMAVSVGDLMPDRGNYTWIRLKTYHANETVLYRYSKPFRIKALETPEATAVDDKIKILSATAGANGKSAVVELVWDDGTPPSTGTELSWDTEEDAWKSTKNPDSYEFTWNDGQRTVETGSEPEVWPGSATITIKDLDESEKYYIKARRYNEGDTTTYSDYSNVATVLTSERPEAVVATADRYVPKGSGLNVYWTFSGNGMQTNWQIVKDTDTVISEGQGAISSTQIPADRLESLAENGDLTYTVQISTGSGWVISEPKTVTLIDKPTLSVNAPAVMQDQNYSFTAISSVPSDLVVIVTSHGATSQFPDGVKMQTSGDTIYSNVEVPEWISGYALTADTTYLDKQYYEKNGDVYEVVVPESESGVVDPSINPAAEGWYEQIEGVSTTVAFADGLDFWDLGEYEISVVAIDRQTELHSDPVLINFSVAWLHQAPSIEPTLTYSLSSDTEVEENKNYYTYDSETQIYTVVETVGDEDPTAEGWYEVSTAEYVTLTPVDSVDESGFHHLAVQIALTPPPDSVEADVYDIYRVTGDGARLIGQSFPLTYTATDEYAPFSDDGANFYRIATRTVDGDVAFSDVGYVLESDGIRLDWEGGFLEYPYGVSISDSYSKDVDIRTHMDGSIGAYWNQGIGRKGSLSTEAIKVIQKSDIELTRQLARYTGPVFVRTREGTAFEADVQVTDLATKNIAIMSIALDASEVDLTEEFMLPIPFALEEEQQGGE